MKTPPPIFVLLIFVLLTAAWLAAPCRAAQADAAWHPAEGPLMTRWARLVSPTNALPAYPRPQMVRRQWQNLNGLWEYAVSDKGAAQAPAYSGRILVPYPIESALSGVMRPFLPTQRLWYRRTFTIPDAWQGQRVLLHFGAVDWATEVFVNGQSLGTHRGGYDEFSFDLSKRLKPGTNEVVVAVTDPTSDGWQLRGKQDLHPGGAAYTATSGIWQTVWLEPVPQSAIEALKMVPDPAAGVLHLTVAARIAPHPLSLTVTALGGPASAVTVSVPIGAELTPTVRDSLVGFYKATRAYVVADVDIPLKAARLWTPDDPFLYALTVDLKDTDGRTLDTVGSYFGMRSVAVGHDAKGNTRLMLNGRPTMLPGALDQGFWPDGLYTAPTDEALRYDIETAKRLGLAAVRKHIKVEPERWYYWCDRLGLLVMQDMPAGYAGDPLTDQPLTPEGAAANEAEMRTLITQRGNHPAIISWDMFNEGWGQFDTVRIADMAKRLDPSRLIDEASGFPHHGAGDVLDIHGGVPPKSATQISIDTETAGNGLAVPGHAWPGTPWATGTYDPKTGGEGDTRNGLYPLDAAARRWYTRAARGLYRDLWAGRDETGCSGQMKVQLTDVENETNGFLSYDRAVLRVDPAPIAAACRGEQLDANVTYLLPTAAVRLTVWRYTVARPAEGWTAPGFDASAWKTGRSAFGNGYDNVHTPWTDTPGDIWLRREFTLTAGPAAPQVRMIHDEETEVYLNGVLACRDGGYISSYDDFDIAPEAAATLKPGRNVIAVHCRQRTGGQVIDVGLVEASRKPSPRAVGGPGPAGH